MTRATFLRESAVYFTGFPSSVVFAALLLLAIFFPDPLCAQGSAPPPEERDGNQRSVAVDDDNTESIRALIIASELNELAQYIRYHDEVLTQSARNYAFTRDEKWQRRYLKHELLLDGVLEEALQKSDDAGRIFLRQIGEVNSLLIEMERRSFALVNAGQSQQAVELLESLAYRQQKKKYAKSLGDFVQWRREQFENALWSARSDHLAIPLTSQERAWLKGHPIIEIPCNIEAAPYQFIGSRGKVTGIMYDVSQALEDRLGVEIKLLPLETKKANEGFARGDYLMSGFYTEAGADPSWPYEAVPVGLSAYTSLFCKEPCNAVSGPEALKGVTVAVMAGPGERSSAVAALAPHNRVMVVQDVAEGIGALAEGNADYYLQASEIVRFHLRRTQNHQIREAYTFPRPIGVVLMVRNDVPLLSSSLHKAVADIERNELPGILGKWLQMDVEPDFQIGLTSEERAWLREHPVIEVPSKIASAPYQFTDSQGRPAGMLRDLVIALEPRLGVDLVLVPQNLREIDRSYRRGEYYLSGLYPKQGVKPDWPYAVAPIGISAYISLFCKKPCKPLRTPEMLKGATIVTAPGSADTAALEALKIHNRTLVADTVAESIGALLEGKADYYLEVNEMVKFHLRRTHRTDILEAYSYPKAIDKVFMVREDAPLLLSALNKALAQIERDELPTILRKWFHWEGEKVSGIELTFEELTWLAENPVVRVAPDPDFPPMEFFDVDGKYSGLVADTMRLLARRVGFELEVVRTENWSEAVEAVRRGDADILGANAPGKKWKADFLWTSPYFAFSDFLVAATGAPPVTDLSDLSGKTVVVVSDWPEQAYLTENWPDINLLEVESTEEGLNKVAFGEYDYLFSFGPTTTYLIEKKLIQGVRLDFTVDRKLGAAVMIRKDLPVLHRILQKALDSVTEEERRVLVRKWVSTGDETVLAPVVAQEDKPGFLSLKLIVQIGLPVMLFTLIVFLLVRVFGKSKKDPFAYQFSTPRGRSMTLVFSTLLVAVMVTTAWYALNRIKGKVQNTLQDSLQGVLATTEQALSYWADEHKKRLEQVVSEREFESFANRQLEAYKTKRNLHRTRSLADLRRYLFAQKERYDAFNLQLIAADGTTVAAYWDETIGKPNPVHRHRPDLFQRAMQGEAVLVPPIPADVPPAVSSNRSKKDVVPTMFFAAPIRDHRGNVVGVVAQSLDPRESFSGLLRTGSIGDTGVSYAIDQQANMLSQSRYPDQLVSTGLLDAGSQEILGIGIRDPGGDMVRGFKPETPRKAWPLTRMAASATRGRAAFDVDGYRDYRGIPVVGAWMWSDRLGLGLATEIEVDEAYGGYYATRLVIVLAIGFATLLAIVFSVFSLSIGERANKALKVSHEQLEELVENRTEELQRTNSELLDSEARLDLVLQYTGFSLWVGDRLTGQTEHTESLEKMLGYKPGELLVDNGRKWRPFVGGNQVAMQKIHPDDIHHYLKLVQDLNENRETRDVEYRVRAADGSWRWLRTYGHPANSEESTMAYGLITDVDEAKRMQLQLMASKDAADAANRAKSVFLANMSHEIRTPMNAVLGYTQILQRDGGLSEDQQKNLQAIDQAGKHLLALIDSVLEMSKIEAGRIFLELEAFDLHEVLSDLETMFRVRAEAIGIDLQINQAADIPRFIEADQRKVRQVLINLLGNAFKFTREGSIAVVPSLIDDSDDGIMLQIAVSDTGVGIAEQELDTIFGAFEQDEDGRNVQGGTGLGLTISKQYAQMMGGDLVVSSDQGEGSTFYFTFRARAVAEVASRKQPALRRVTGLAAGQEFRRVLVVDDRDYNRDILVKLLVPLGFEVETANDGAEGVEVFKRFAPHIVLMDIRMPVMDGVTASRTIRDLPGGDEVVIIAVSASAMEEQRIAVLERGADGFLPKPFREAELFAAMAELAGVRFVYEETVPADKIAAEEPARLTTDALAVLPRELLREIAAATRAGDMDRFEKVCEQVTKLDAPLAASLTALVDDFEYQCILDLLTPLLDKVSNT